MSRKLVTIKQEGQEVSLAEILKQFDEFPERVQKNALRSATRSACALVRDEARLLAPSVIERKEIITNTRRSRNKNIVRATTEVKNPLGHIIEFGTSPHLIKVGAKGVLINKSKGFFSKKNVNHPGAIAKPFMRPALAKCEQRIISTIEDTLKKRITKLKG